MWWVAQNCAMAALLAGLVWLHSRLFHPSPATRHALWLLVLIKLVTPPLLVSPAPLPAAWRESVGAWLGTDCAARSLEIKCVTPATDSAGLRDPVRIELIPAIGPPSSVAAVSEPAAIGRSDLTERLVGAARRMRPLAGSLAVAGWLLGAVAVAAIELLRIERLRSVLKGRGPVSAAFAHEIAELATALGIRTPAVVSVPGLKSPLVWSCFRPTLAWPAELEDGLSPVSRRAVALHELAHLRRRDHWVGWLELLAGCAWWWNPLYWYVRRQLRDNAELACDAWVIATLPAARRDYAEALIDVSQRLPLAAVPTPAMSLGRCARHTFERRLTMILRERVPNKMPALGLAAVVLLAMVVVPAWSIGQEAAEPPAAAPALVISGIPQPEDVAIEVAPGPASVEAVPVLVPRVELVSQDPMASPAAPASASTPAVAAQPAHPTTDDAQRRLKLLEEQIAQLQAEIRALRGGSAATTGTTSLSSAFARKGYTAPAPIGSRTLYAYPASDRAYAVRPGPTTFEVQTLGRGTYKLPQAKAEALAAFLREQLADDVDVKVQGDSLIVTAAPETLSSITHFIVLFQKPAGKDGQAKPDQPESQNREPAAVPAPRR